MWTDQLQTMQHTYQEIVNGETPWVPLGNFINDFFYNFADQRETLITDAIQEPEDPTQEQHQWAVFCAASVDYLCKKYQVPVPSWSGEERYAPLSEPWYMASEAALRQPDVLEEIKNETPEPFARRNIYCGDRVYVDKREEAAKLRRLLKSA
jgi:hypothetical protein